MLTNTHFSIQSIHDNILNFHSIEEHLANDYVYNHYSAKDIIDFITEVGTLIINFQKPPSWQDEGISATWSAIRGSVGHTREKVVIHNHTRFDLSISFHFHRLQQL